MLLCINVFWDAELMKTQYNINVSSLLILYIFYTFMLSINHLYNNAYLCTYRSSCTQLWY